MNKVSCLLLHDSTMPVVMQIVKHGKFIIAYKFWYVLYVIILCN